MSTIENPQITLLELDKLEDKIKDNSATRDDYIRIDYYIKFLTGVLDFFLNKLKENKIPSYEDFIYQRKKQSSSELNVLVGTALGMISVLKKYVTGK
jgi:hypothetical protein